MLIDGLETMGGVAGSSKNALELIRSDCTREVKLLARRLSGNAAVAIVPNVKLDVAKFGIGPYTIDRIAAPSNPLAAPFHLQAPTTLENVFRVLRACQLPKSILLEGSPGVGKTSLVQALADATGRRLCRINLSEQTDLIDLFGSDLPVIGGRAGEFAWRDAAFLTALRCGDWVLLDEMNLASQAILEGLNAVLDHRGSVYIPELGRSFDKHPSFRIFAAQNPVGQGGGRKGLPKSFLNRFSKVYVMEHTMLDLAAICRQRYPDIPLEQLEAVIALNQDLALATTGPERLGRSGAPWEFNLRDIMRWLQVQTRRNGLEFDAGLGEFAALCYIDRFRTPRDRQLVANMVEKHLGHAIDLSKHPWRQKTVQSVQVGHTLAPRDTRRYAPTRILEPQHPRLAAQESILKAVEMNWLVILTGAAGRGKRSTIRELSDILGIHLRETRMHSGSDTMEMLGSFEQTEPMREVQSLVSEVQARLGAMLDHQGLDASLTAMAERHLERLSEIAIEKQDYLRAIQDAIAWLDAQGALVHDLAARLSTTREAMTGDMPSSFAWTDGPLVEALRKGDWFLINDANLCAPSVLDRLNGLCELGGVLILNEKGNQDGAAEVIQPHPNFRLFMCFDPKQGELSRAMRNRGMEICVRDDTPLGEASTGQIRQPSSILQLSNMDCITERFLLHLGHRGSTYNSHEIARAFAMLSPADSWSAARMLRLSGSDPSMLHPLVTMSQHQDVDGIHQSALCQLHVSQKSCCRTYTRS